MSTNTKNWEEVIKKAEAEAEAQTSSKTPSQPEDERHKEQNAHGNQLQPQKKDNKNSQAEESESIFSEENILEHPTYIEMENKLTEAEKLANKYWNDLLRTKADLDNFQRRAERDIANAHKYAVEKIAFALLGVVDNLERCLENKVIGDVPNNEVFSNVYTGVELTLKMFLEVLQKFEIKQLDPLGEKFNPEYHTAMTVKEEAKAKPNTVLQVVQKGYMLKDRLLRPALVIVAK